MRTLLRDLGTVSGVQCACIVRGGEVLASSFPEKEAVAQAASLGFVRGIADGLEGAGREFDEMVVDFAGRSLLVAPVTKDFVLAMLAAPDANTQLLRVVMGSSVRQLRRMNDIPEKPEPAAARPAARPAAAAPPPRPQGAAAPPQAQGAAPATGRPPAPSGRPQPPSRPAPPPPPIKGQQPAKPQQAAPQAAAKTQAPDKPAPAAAAASKAADKDAEPILPQVLALLTEYIGPVARVSFKRGVTKWREKGSPTVGTLGELAKILAADLSTDSEKKAFLDAVERLRGN